MENGSQQPDASRGPGIALFETGLGHCAIAWSERGVVAVGFPESRPERTLARLRRRVPDAVVSEPPAAIAAAIDRITRLLAGEEVDLTGIELDFGEIDAFERRIYRAARGIAPGETHTYGELAAAIGRPGEAREVGRAMARNPIPIIVPCHRVVAADGRLGGFSAPGGTETKRRLLAIEGRHARGPMTLFEPPPRGQTPVRVFG